MSPPESLKALKLPQGLVAELVASEPLISDPVAIDWDADGRLWVCEMNDYPTGIDEEYQPGGRVRLLTDTNNDGIYDQSTIFLDDLPFPTGVLAWRRGVFICAAPDILFAIDTTGDGRADRVERVFTGFATDNYQARVNSLSLGLDNWIYGANGLLGGIIRRLDNSLFTPASSPLELNIRNRDFRFHPVRGDFEWASGLTQQGRVRDDWGNWFGCDNSRLLLHYPLAERYVRRNPYGPPIELIRHLTGRRDGNRLFPASRLLERFNDFDHANRVTSACGIGIYRDTLLGADFEGDAFICEAVHNLVHREKITFSNGVAQSQRPPSESESEFLASTDHWFRPAQVRTGPDGALYVVDIYRFLIEHPRWIPAARLTRIDVRAGADRGRIYRIRARGTELRPVRDLTRMDVSQLVAALDSPNGTERDRVHAELLLRSDRAVAADLESLARHAARPQVRLQALSVLEGLSALNLDMLLASLRDPDARVRREVVRFCESFLREDSADADSNRVLEALLHLTSDPEPMVRHQLALSLGESSSTRAARALASMAREGAGDPVLRTAILTSPPRHAFTVLEALLADPFISSAETWIPPLIATVAGHGDARETMQALQFVLPSPGVEPTPTQLQGLVLLTAAAGPSALDQLATREQGSSLRARFEEALRYARRVAQDQAAQAESLRTQAVRLLGNASRATNDLGVLASAAVSDPAERVRLTAMEVLRAWDAPQVAPALLRDWDRALPATRNAILATLVARDDWAAELIKAIDDGRVRWSEVPLTERQRLIANPSAAIRDLAAKLLPVEDQVTPDAAIASHRMALEQGGVSERGKEVFARHCSACHQRDGTGHAVGPDLAALRQKEPDYWLKNTLDPNAVVEPRYTAYLVTLDDGTDLTGVIQAETSTHLTVASGSGVVTTVPRSKIRSLEALKLSLMPEGFGQVISPREMADLIAYLRTEPTHTRATARGDEVLRDPASVARFILNDRQPEAERTASIRSNPQFAAALIREMTRDLVPGTREEYRRIPWIWRVAIACGRRNDPPQLREVLEASLPHLNEPLRDWQSVVIGGGIINGVSERQPWPGDRIVEIIAGDRDLSARWLRALDLAAEMADDTRIPQGTRYDALRMLGVDLWAKRGAHLARYLQQGTPEELQMGAVSGLVDMKGPEAAMTLIGALPHLAGRNRELAIQGLFRVRERRHALVEEIQRKEVPPDLLGPTQIKLLLEDEDPAVRDRAQQIFNSPSPRE